MVQVLVKFLLVFLLIISSISPGTALSFTEDPTPEFIFAQDADSSLIFTCVKSNDNLCDATYGCNMTVIYPNSSILVDNSPATRQGSYYNLSLPDTSTIGTYVYHVFCGNGTDFGASTELTYLINLTGEELSISKTILYIFVLLITLVLFLLSLLGAVKIPWNNKTDDEGYIVNISDLKYIKLLLWFVTYIFLLFITWLTASISKFLELGMASGFFDLVYLALLVFLFPVFVIVFLIGILKAFSDKNLDKMLGRNLRFK